MAVNETRGAGGGSGTDWVNPNNVAAEDDNPATYNVLGSSTSSYLISGNYGFSIPVSAVILGIWVERRARASESGFSISDSVMAITKDGINPISNQLNIFGYTDTFSYRNGYPGSGGSTQLWGTTWTAAEINASTFGFMGRYSNGSGGDRGIEVDHDKITVYYQTYLLTGSTAVFVQTGIAATLKIGRRITAGTATFVLTGKDATVKRGVPAMDADTGVFAFTGQAAGLRKSFVPLTANTRAYAVTTQAASLRATRRLSGDAGAYTVSGVAANFNYNHPLAAATGVYLLTGIAPTLLRSSNTLSANTVAYVLSGKEATLARTRRMEVTTVAYVMAGVAATLREGKPLSAGTGVFMVSGQAAALSKAWKVVITSTPYSLTANDAGVLRGFKLPAVVSTFVLTGMDSILSLGRSVISAKGTLALTGIDASLKYNRVLTADTRTYAIAGMDAEFPAIRKLIIAGPGVFTVTGNAAGLKPARGFEAVTTTYVMAGSSASLRRQHVPFLASTVAYVLAGQAVNLKKGRIPFSADTSSFVLVGQQSALRLSRKQVATSTSFVMAGSSVGLRASRKVAGGTASYGLSLWTPSNLVTAPAVWAKADSIVASNGDQITTWNDVSGNNRHFIQNVPVWKPLYQANVDGLPALKYDPSIGAESSNRTSPFGLVQPEFHFIVVRLDSYLAGAQIKRSAGDTRLYQFDSAGTIGLWAGGSQTGTITLPLNEFHLIGVLYHGANTELRLDGGTDVFPGNVGAQNGNDVWIGNQSFMHIREVITLDYAAATADRQRIEGYLCHKWRIADRLPVGHPYKSSPPTIDGPNFRLTRLIAASTGVYSLAGQTTGLYLSGREEHYIKALVTFRPMIQAEVG